MGGHMIPNNKVLIVDDDPVHLKLMRKWLETEGFAVTTHDSPFGATARMFRLRPQIVLLDVQMPGLEGSSLIELLRRPASIDPTVILCSCRDQTELDALALQHGAAGAIQKTPRREDFIRQLRHVL